MDSDDDDCLRIVDDVESDAEIQDAVKEEETEKTAADEYEPLYPVAVKEEKTTRDEQEAVHPDQKKLPKSRLPASLRNRIARSNARSGSLLATDVGLKTLRRPNPKPCAAKSRPRIPRISKAQAIKEEESCDFEAALRELSLNNNVDSTAVKDECDREHPRKEDRSCDFEAALKKLSFHDNVGSTAIKEECDGETAVKDEPIDQGRTNIANSLGTGNTIVGRKLNVFSHPRLRKGDRLTKLIDPLASAVNVKSRAPRIAKKTCLAGNFNTPSAGMRKRFEKKASVIKSNPEKTACKVAGTAKKKKSGSKSFVGEELTTKNSKVKEPFKRCTKVPTQAKHEKEPAKKARAGKQAKTVDATDSDEDDFFYSLKPGRPLGKRTTVNDCDSDAGTTEEHLTRAGRRKLTRSLLREGKRMTRSRKTTAYSTARKRMSRIHCTEEESGIETFDSFLKFPAIRVNTEEEFVIEPSEDMKRLYEDFQVNVLGEGVDMNFAELKKRVQDRVRIQKEKIAEAERLRAKLEDEDVLGTEPFLDAIAYRKHPKVTRGYRAMNTVTPTCNMLESQVHFNSSVLSELSGTMCRIKPFQPLILLRDDNNKFHQVANFLDEISGMAEQAKLRKCDRYETLKLERIIEEKIEKVKNRMKGVRSGEQPTFAETEQTGPSPCSSNGSEKNNSNALEKDGSFDHDSSLNLVDDDILCIYDSSNSWLSP